MVGSPRYHLSQFNLAKVLKFCNFSKKDVEKVIRTVITQYIPSSLRQLQLGISNVQSSKLGLLPGSPPPLFILEALPDNRTHAPPRNTAQVRDDW